MPVIAAVLFAVGLVLRLVDGADLQAASNVDVGPLQARADALNAAAGQLADTAQGLADLDAGRRGTCHIQFTDTRPASHWADHCAGEHQRS